jgi:hypothetical protein
VYDDRNYDYYGQTRRIPEEETGGGSDRSSRVDAKKLWAGGGATVIVAVLVAFVGLLVARGLFQVPVLAPNDAGLVGDSTTIALCTIAAVAALVATGLMHLLLLTVPSPRTFFVIIITLITLVFALQPLTMSVSVGTKIATVLVYLVTGAAIGFSVSTVANSAERPRAHR